MPTWSYAPSPNLTFASERVLSLHVLRHPSCSRASDEICGQLDPPLDALGLNDTQSIVRWWLRSGPRVQAIVASDLIRCRDLATALSQSLSVPAFFDWRLREQSFGRWEGQRWSELTLFDALATAVWHNPWSARPPEGECLADVADRVRQWWDSLVRETSLTQLAVVTHAGPLRLLTAGALGLPTTELLRLAPVAPSYTELTFSTSGGVLSCFGTRPWATHEQPHR